MRTTNFTEIPSRMNDLWDWVVALDAWDYCDPIPLSELIFKNKTIPDEFVSAIADVVSGTRKQNKKAAAKQKIPPSERMKIAASISINCGLIYILKYQANYPEGKGAIGIGAMKAIEPSEILRELEAEQALLIEESAKELNVSVETIENLLRAMREKINKFPIV